MSAWDAASAHAVIAAVAERAGAGLGKVAQPLRVALSGGTVSPPIDQTASLLGRERVLERIGRALAYTRQQGGQGAPGG